jgi:hypothetical protein
VIIHGTSALRKNLAVILPKFSAGVLFVSAFVFRYLFIFRWHPPSGYIFSDMAGFVTRAQHLIDHRFPLNDTLFPPGEHLLIAASGSLFHGFDTLVVWVHLIAGILTCYWVWKAAKVYLGKIGALVVLAVCAFHFPFIALSGYYLAETVFTGLLALLLFLTARMPFPWGRGRSVSIGIVAALGLVWKGNNVFFFPLLALWSFAWLVRYGAGKMAEAYRCWYFLLFGFALIIASQCVYFYKLYGVALPVASGGAYNFVLDKCPGSRIVDRSGAYFQSPRTYYTGGGGVQAYDRYFYEQRYFWRVGLECVCKEPWTLITSFKNIYYLFYGNQLWPVNKGGFAQWAWFDQRGFAFLVYPGLAVGFLALARSPLSPKAVPFLLCLSISASSWFFLSEMRFRIPFDVVFIPLGIMGWEAAYRVFRGPCAQATREADEIKLR